MADFSSLSFELDGIPKMLISLEEVEAAIARGKITPDTRVTVYLSDRSSKERPAASHAELAPLFARHAPPPDPQPAPAAPAPTSTPAPAPAQTPEQDTKPKFEDKRLASPSLTAASASGGHKDADDDMAPAPSTTITLGPPPAAKPKAGGCGKTLLGLILLAAALIVVVKLFGGTMLGGDFVPDYVDDIAPYEAATVAQMNDTERAAAAGTFYLIRATNVRSAPNAQSDKWGMLDRGTTLKGLFIPSQSDPTAKWLYLIEGEFAGGYVSAINIIENAPPYLDVSDAGDYILTSEVALYAGPNSNGAVVSRGPAYLSAGQHVSVTGQVAGMAEIQQQGGGVAYIEWSAIADQVQP